LGAVCRQCSAQTVEHGQRKPARVTFGFQHDGRNRTDQHSFRDASLAMAGNIPRHLSAACRVTDMDRLMQIKGRGQFSNIGGIRIHVVSAVRLC